MDSNAERLLSILERAKSAAIDYYRLTGKPLGVTGEIGEYVAAKLLALDLCTARSAGFDATDNRGRRIQIKTRAVGSGRRLRGQVGSIRLDHEWDVVMLVLLTNSFDPIAIYEANRQDVEAALLLPGSKARNERGSLAISKFKSIGQKIWPSEMELSL